MLILGEKSLWTNDEAPEGLSSGWGCILFRLNARRLKCFDDFLSYSLCKWGECTFMLKLPLFKVTGWVSFRRYLLVISSM